MLKIIHFDIKKIILLFFFSFVIFSQAKFMEKNSEFLQNCKKYKYFTNELKILINNYIKENLHKKRPNTNNRDNWTLFDYLVFNNNIKAIQYFLNSVLSQALENKKIYQEEISKYLDTKDINGNTSLHIAVKHIDDPTNIIVLLISKHRANPDATNFLKNTPLHIASKLGKVDTVKTLLKLGADPLIINAKEKMADDCTECQDCYKQTEKKKNKCDKHEAISILLFNNIYDNYATLTADDYYIVDKSNILYKISRSKKKRWLKKNQDYKYHLLNQSFK